jgi:hypothetical protein
MDGERFCGPQHRRMNTNKHGKTSAVGRITFQGVNLVVDSNIH